MSNKVKVKNPAALTGSEKSTLPFSDILSHDASQGPLRDTTSNENPQRIPNPDAGCEGQATGSTLSGVEVMLPCADTLMHLVGLIMSSCPVSLSPKKDCGPARKLLTGRIIYNIDS